VVPGTARRQFVANGFRGEMISGIGFNLLRAAMATLTGLGDMELNSLINGERERSFEKGGAHGGRRGA